LNTQDIADQVGLDTDVVRNILQNLSAIHVVKRTGSGDSLSWKIESLDDKNLIRKIEKLDNYTTYESRNVSVEETDEAEKIANANFENL
jgi:predicted RNase H-related nuclease YkuK (DUF458 family)